MLTYMYSRVYNYTDNNNTSIIIYILKNVSDRVQKDDVHS